VRAEYPSQLEYRRILFDLLGKTAVALRGAHDTGLSKVQPGFEPASIGSEATLDLSTGLHKGIPPPELEPRVIRARAEYPSQLNYSGSCLIC